MLLLLGCAPATCPAGSSPGTDGLCYLDDEPEQTDTTTIEPTLSEAEAIAALSATLAVGLPEPMGLAAQYASTISSNGDSTCPFVSPPSEEGAEGGVWAGDCTAETGWRFSGQSLYLLTTLSEDALTTQTLEMASSFEMTAPSGAIFQGGGEVAFERLTTGTAAEYEGHIGGLYAYPEGSGWLSEVSSTALLYAGGRDEGGAWLTLNGGVGVGEQIIDFIDLSLDTTVCDGAPSGELGIRDGTGLWYALTLDCDTCGTLSWLGEPLGEHCIDLTAPLADLRDALEEG